MQLNKEIIFIKRETTAGFKFGDKNIPDESTLSAYNYNLTC